jgi:hypothetical protein
MVASQTPFEEREERSWCAETFGGAEQYHEQDAFERILAAYKSSSSASLIYNMTNKNNVLARELSKSVRVLCSPIGIP